MLRKIAFLTRKAGLSPAAFTEYWRRTHGPVVSQSPGYGAWRLRYAQNHVIGPGPLGAAFDYDGMAEFDLPGDSPNEDAFSTTEVYRDRIRVDEQNFIDMDRTVSMTAVEDVKVAGEGVVKLVVLSRDPDCPSEVVDSRFRARVRAWRTARVLDGTFRLPGAREAPVLSIGRVDSLWFDTPADMAAACASAPAALSAAVASFVAKELVFFANGAPRDPTARSTFPRR